MSDAAPKSDERRELPPLSGAAQNNEGRRKLLRLSEAEKQELLDATWAAACATARATLLAERLLGRQEAPDVAAAAPATTAIADKGKVKGKGQGKDTATGLHCGASCRPSE